MTKTKMIEKMQNKASALWENLKMQQYLAMYKYPEHGGRVAEQEMEEELTVKDALSQWYAVASLLDDLGIGYDSTDAAMEYQESIYRYFYK